MLSLLNFFKIDIPKNRIFGLDLLRAIAILLVLFVHSKHFLPKNIAHFLNKYILIDGVGLFFVLSGFLIGGIFIKDFEKDISFKSLLNFWKRRWYRTLPNYFLILSSLLLLSIPEIDFANFQYFIFLQNLYTPISHFFSESWSLSIEEWFYLTAPLLIFGILSVSKNKISLKYSILIIALLMMLFPTLLRAYRYFTLEIPKSFHTWDLYFNRQVITRLDSIMIGVVGAWLQRYYPSIFFFKKNILFIIGTMSLFLLHIFQASYDPHFYITSFSFNALAALMLIPFLYKMNNSFSNKVKCDVWIVTMCKLITYISLISYSLYLTNLSLISFRIPNDNNNDSFNLIGFMAFWIISFLLSTLIYKYFEVPTTKLRDKK